MKRSRFHWLAGEAIAGVVRVTHHLVMRRDTDGTSHFPPSGHGNNSSNLQPRLLVPIQKLENMLPLVSAAPLNGDTGTNSSFTLDSIPQFSNAINGICISKRPNPVIQNQCLPGIIPGMDQQTSNLITNSTIANFISQLASNISTSLMNRAVANFTNNRGLNNPVSSLEEIGELASGLSTLAINLSASITKIIAANSQIPATTTIQNVIPPSSGNTSIASDTLKSLLTKPGIQQPRGKENLPIIIDDDDDNGTDENILTLKPIRSRNQKNQRRKGVSREEVKQFINQR
ncbi:hypothetical protein ACTXT7_002545 [Hymenolepis weldensis]